MTRQSLPSHLSRLSRLFFTLSACLITWVCTPQAGVSEPTPQAKTTKKTPISQNLNPLTLTQLREGFKVVGLIINERLAREALPTAREALKLAQSSKNTDDPFALDEALLTLADALHLEAGRCSGELDRLRRLMAWLTKTRE